MLPPLGSQLVPKDLWSVRASPQFGDQSPLRAIDYDYDVSSKYNSVTTLNPYLEVSKTMGFF